jgi:hypothetical protein
MIDSDRAPFAALMATLAEVFGESSTLKMQAYWMALAPYPFGAIERAAMAILRSRKTSVNDLGQTFRSPWPTPGDFIAEMDRQAEAGEEQRPVRKAIAAPQPHPENGEKIRAMLRATAEHMGFSNRDAAAANPAHRAKCPICRRLVTEKGNP